MGFAETIFSIRETEDFEGNVIFPYTAHIFFAPIKEGTVVAVDIKLPLQNKIRIQCTLSWTHLRSLIFKRTISHQHE